MILKFNRQVICMCFVIGDSNVFGWTFENNIVLHQDPIDQHRNGGRGGEHPIFIKTGSLENNVVVIPVTWTSQWIHQRWVLFVDTSSLAIGIGFTYVAI